MRIIKNHNKQTIRFKLTLSHFLVTVISVFVLELLFISAYLFYLRTDFDAEWAGIWAAELADGMSVKIKAENTLKDSAKEFADIFDHVYFRTENEQIQYPADSEWMLVISPSKKVVVSTVKDRFQAGTDIDVGDLPGFSQYLLPKKRDDDEFRFDSIAYSHEKDGDVFIGQATIVNEKGDLAGWVYYGATERERWLFIRDMFLTYFGVLAAASVVALLLSGWLCEIIARSYSNRLTHLRDASVAIASGDFSVSVPVKDGDEIDQVGEQFNSMAIQLQERIKELRDLADRNAMLAEEASALASLEERNRIARDLHDAVKQQLFGFTLSTDAAVRLMDKDSEKAKKLMNELSEQARTIQLELDEVIQQLRPSSLNDRGLSEALREFCLKWKEGTGITAEVCITGEREISLNTEYTLFRIAQEALNNIKRHAEANHVKILLDYDMNSIQLCVEDNGKGLDLSHVDKPLSSGIKSMKERTEEHFGSFEIQSKPGTGTIVCAKIPVGGIR